MTRYLHLCLRLAKLAGSIAVLLIASGCASNPPAGAEDESLESAVLAQFEGLSLEEITQSGDEAAQRGEWERAIFVYMQALAIEETGDTWFKTGKAYDQLGNRDKAWQAYATTLQIDPEHALAYEEIGMAYLGAKRKDQAKQYLKKAVELDPTLWRTNNVLGVLADSEEDYVHAIQHYETALKYNPESAMLLNNLGYSHYLAGNLTTAEQHFRMAIAVTNDYKPAIANIGLIYARRGQYERSVEMLRTIMDRAQAYNDSGYVAFHNDDLEQAAELLAEAIRISPTYYETAYQNLAKVEKAIKEQNRGATETQDELSGKRNEIALRDGHKPEHKEVEAPWLHVRQTNSPDAEVVGYLKGGDRVDVLFDNGNWAFIAFGETISDSSATGWVRSRYLADSRIAKTE
jgi:tetratricopeptide (TPR) repeat protein